MGVWGILGNHDHFIDPRRSEWALEAAGIQPLVNSAVTLRAFRRFSRPGRHRTTCRRGTDGNRTFRCSKIPDVVPDLPLPPAAGLAPGSSGRRPPDDLPATPTAGRSRSPAATSMSHASAPAISQAPTVAKRLSFMFREASASARYRCGSVHHRRSISSLCAVPRQARASRRSDHSPANQTRDYHQFQALCR